MPARDNPTARQVRLGTELKKLRLRSGKLARHAAGLFQTDQARISNIEAGKIGISAERVRKLAVFYECDDTALIEALCEITEEQRGQFWWDDYRRVLPPAFLDIAELEHHAVRLRYLQPVTFPGILQTEDYARAVFESVVPKLPSNEVQSRIDNRMQRKGILDRETPPAIEAIVHEAALRMRIGGRQVARAQLEHLMESSELPGITVRVIPFAHEDFIHLTQTVLYADGIVPQLDTVHLDNSYDGRFLDAEAELEKYRTLIGFAEQASLEPAESLSFIHHIAREL
ncbi:helix-turn-helix domain-containing protein [Streptomyces sp. NPDC088258]|uniref:helix-turn-helix domain-containing protein n=1 Tax=Streptomyces sp. NPDC088258 TaxID=3365849 RepID=UPI003813EBA3